MMVNLISYVAWLFGTINCLSVLNHQRNFYLRFINIVSTSSQLNISIQSRAFSSDLTSKIFL